MNKNKSYWIVSMVFFMVAVTTQAALLAPSKPGGLLTPPLNFSNNKIGFASSSPYGQISIENNNSLAASTSPLLVVSDNGSSTPYFLIESLWGRIGIQNDNPTATLHIGANAGDTPFRIGSTTPQFEVTSKGRIGIGTSTPDFELSIDSGSTGTTTINLGDISDIGTKDSPGCINMSGVDGNWYRMYIGYPSGGTATGLITEAGKCNE